MKEYNGQPQNREVRLVLERARGAKLTARQVTAELGHDAGPTFQPSNAMQEVIRALAQLEQREVVRCAMPTAQCTEITYWIEPPKESARG